MKQKAVKVSQFIRIEEKKSKYGKDKFYGILRHSDDEVITASVVKIDSGTPWIYIEDFKRADYEITQADPEDVKHFFKTAKAQTEKDFDSAEFDLREMKRKVATANERYDEYFKDIK